MVFIGSEVQDSQTLIDNISGASEIIVLNDEQDELVQISEHIKNYHQLDAVHIVSHGESGQLSFGNAILNSDTLPEYEEMIQEWSLALDEEADLLLYGCDVASDETGNSFVEELSQISKADVSASVDDTGISGDWELETSVGEVEATSVFTREIEDAYQHDLQDADITLISNQGSSGGGGSGGGGGFDSNSGDRPVGGGSDGDDDSDAISLADTSTVVSLAKNGYEFDEVSPERLATIDFNNIPAEDFQILKEAGLSIAALNPETLANINLGVIKNFDYLSQVELTQTRFDQNTLFGDLSATFASNANLYTYKPDLAIESGLTLDKLDRLSQSDFKALEYAYLADGALDADFYLQEYSDVKNDGVNPFTHYAETGSKLAENRYPNPAFKGLAESETILLASANTDFQVVKDAASTIDESDTTELAFAPAIPLIYYTISGVVVFTIIGLETLRQANSWNEALESSDFEYFKAPGLIVGPLPDVSTTSRLPQPEQKLETVLKFPDSNTDAGIDTGTPPFNLEEAIEVNVLDFPNANDSLQDLLDGQFEFPTDDEIGFRYFDTSQADPNWSTLYGTGAKSDPNISFGSPTLEDSMTEKELRGEVVGSVDTQPGAINNKRRKNFEKGFGNIGFGDYNIDGETGRIESFSGKENLEGFAEYIPNADRNLKATEVNGRVADVDTEAKILEQILDDTTAESKGEIRLFTKIPVCGSCGKVIEEFVKRRPGIKVEVIEGI